MLRDLCAASGSARWEGADVRFGERVKDAVDAPITWCSAPSDLLRKRHFALSMYRGFQCLRGASGGRVDLQLLDQARCMYANIASAA